MIKHEIKDSDMYVIFYETQKEWKEEHVMGKELKVRLNELKPYCLDRYIFNVKDRIYGDHIV